MAALVAALLVRASDPSPGLVAVISDRSQRIGATVAGVWLAMAATQGVAAAAGLLVAPHLSPNAARLLLAMTLLAAGATALVPFKPVTIDTVHRPFTTTIVRLIASGLGDRAGFVTFAIAAGGVPALAGIGGAIGGGIVLSGAAIAGEIVLAQLPRRAIGIVLGAILLVAGAWIALSAFRLI